jgi:hypothetical protein
VAAVLPQQEQPGQVTPEVMAAREQHLLLPVRPQLMLVVEVVVVSQILLAAMAVAGLAYGLQVLSLELQILAAVVAELEIVATALQG